MRQILYLISFLYVMSVTKVVAQEPLLVLTETWTPFNYKNQQGEIVGSSTRWIKALFAKADLSYKLELMPWQRAINLAKSKGNTAIYSIYRSNEREHFFYWICPLPNGPIHKVFKLTSRKDIVINSIKDLAKYRINVVRGAYTYDYMSSLGLKDNLRLTANNTVNVPMLLSGRVDLITDFDGAIDLALKEKGMKKSDVEVVHTFNEHPSLCIAVNKQTPQATIDKLIYAQQALLNEKAK